MYIEVRIYWIVLSMPKTPPASRPATNYLKTFLQTRSCITEGKVKKKNPQTDKYMALFCYLIYFLYVCSLKTTAAWMDRWARCLLALQTEPKPFLNRIGRSAISLRLFSSSSAVFGNISTSAAYIRASLFSSITVFNDSSHQSTLTHFKQCRNLTFQMFKRRRKKDVIRN